MRLLSSEVPIRPLHLVVLIATLVALPPLLGACDGDVTVRANSICDGIQQATEDPVDAPFDLDGDGFYDDGNPQCAENYDADQLDCDDDDPDVNPDGTEVQCDGLDNDCDEETLDGEDLDEDGSLACDDCDDLDAANFPGNPEICDGQDNDCDGFAEEGAVDADGDGFTPCENDCDDDDPTVYFGATELCDGLDNNCDGLPNADVAGEVDVDGDTFLSCVDCDDFEIAAFPGNPEICDDIDNNCNGDVDEGCETFDDYSGTWIVTPSISYACALNNVTISVTSLTITDVSPTILVAGSGGVQPGSMSGTFSTATEFSATNSISSGGGGCDEEYAVTGEFISADQMTGTLTADFVDTSGLGACFDCVNQSWAFTAVR